jgi:hypothetical protein
VAPGRGFAFFLNWVPGARPPGNELSPLRG